VATHAEMRVDPLDAKRHDRASFSCGVSSLDAYLKTQASQDLRRKANAVFVLVENAEPDVILGYFTLCACGIAPGVIPEAVHKHLPRYPQISATLIGRLAVAEAHQGRGLGGALLVRALRKAYDSADMVGSSMVVVDAMNESAARFYAAHGFLRLPESARLVLPMHTIGALFASGLGTTKTAR